MPLDYDAGLPSYVLKQKYADALREIRRLKEEHKNLVERNAFLRQRPDLPVDRIPAYLRLKAENDKQARRIDLLESLLETIALAQEKRNGTGHTT